MSWSQIQHPWHATDLPTLLHLLNADEEGLYLWILGNHRLPCGDSSKPEDLDRLLGGKTIQLVNTDPPYNVKVEPRSNNAIAAGLSSFSNDSASQKLKGGQGNAASFGVDHETGKPKHAPTHKKLRAKDRPLANDFVSDDTICAGRHAVG